MDRCAETGNSFEKGKTGKTKEYFWKMEWQCRVICDKIKESIREKSKIRIRR
jgi:hypothetical protein